MLPGTEIWILWLIPIVLMTFGLSGLVVWNIHQKHVRKLEDELDEQHEKELDELHEKYGMKVSKLKQQLSEKRKVSVFGE